MREIPITDDEKQDFSIDANGESIEIKVRYNAVISQWSMSVVGQQDGMVLATGLTIMDTIRPYNFTVYSNNKTGVSPHNYDDFSGGNYSLILLERDDMIKVRGYDVS